MKRRFCYGFLALSLILAPFAVFLISCGGGGGGSAGGTAPAAGTGSVSVLLTDGPANDYRAIRVWITEVSLIPYGEDKSPVTIFEKPEPGLPINLLDYRHEDYLLTFAENVPAGLYSKIRLRISDIDVEGGVCSDLELKLPSGRIDLNPREPFRVSPGGEISIRLDMDANKSILLGQAGNSGKCIFRPVVFVDIEAEQAPQRCPSWVSGKISNLATDASGTTAFKLYLGDGRGEIEVTALPDTPVFDAKAQFSSPSALRDGQEVKVRGRLVECGVLQASLVIIGDVVDVKGIVDTPYSGQTFSFTPAEGEELVNQHTVGVVEGKTLVLVDCDSEVLPGDYIQPGASVRIIGKLVAGGGADTLKAAAVLVKPTEVLGTITGVLSSGGGKTVTVREDGTSLDVFVPAGMPINLEGGGTVPADFLCPGRMVRIPIDQTIFDPLTAQEVYVEEDSGAGTVKSIIGASRTLVLVSGLNVIVPTDAKIMDSRGDQQTEVDFGAIAVNDFVIFFGLTYCGGTDFYAPTVTIAAVP